MKTLCIAPCGDRKIWKKYPDAGLQEARKVYTGPYADKCIEYAEKFYPTSYCILSAKYGFLFPEDKIPGPYNVTFKNKKTNPITDDDLSIQIKDKGLFEFDRIIILGGKDYSDILKKLFVGKELYEPLSGLRLGFRIAKLNEAIKKGIPIE